jgi:hypothetical protein
VARTWHGPGAGNPTLLGGDQRIKIPLVGVVLAENLIHAGQALVLGDPFDLLTWIRVAGMGKAITSASSSGARRLIP